jgi:hypothetical protein
MQELEVVCQEAARNIVERAPRPLAASVVLPLPTATRITTLQEWPDDDGERFDLLDRFAQDVMRPANAPCFGFIAEGEAEVDGAAMDIVVVAYGARGQESQVMAAPLTEDGVGDFTPSEPLEPAAFPFLAPLTHAVAAATPPDAFGGVAN